MQHMERSVMLWLIWNITPNDDNAYQNNLDATLLNQADAPADDKIDLFLVEADYCIEVCRYRLYDAN